MSQPFLSTQRYYLLRWLILISLGLIIYYQTFSFGFVFDDDWFVVTNPHIKNFHNIWDAFIKLPLTRTIGIFSFAFNYSINGLDPRGYHIFNFIVHLLAAGLVWGISSLLFKLVGFIPFNTSLVVVTKKHIKKAPVQDVPFLIAVLFLVHPCQTQAVTYISQRFESMATVFYLGTFYCYLLARISPKGMRKVGLFVGAGFLSILGIMTKEVSVTIPLMLLAAELLILPVISKGIIPPRSKNTNRFNRLRVCFILTIGAILFSLLFMKLVRAGLNIFFSTIESESHDWDMLTPGNYFLTQMRVFLTFTRLLIFPIHQNLDYDYPMSIGLLHPPLTLVGMCLIGGIIFLIVKLRRNLPLVSFGLAWMLVTFSINMAPRANVIFEHKLYLISFGFFLAAISALGLYVRSRTLFFGLIGCVILLFSVLSFQRNQVWKNNVTLWEDTIQKSPHKKRVMANVALSYMRVNRYEDALSVFNRFMTPLDLKSYTARGQIYFEVGNYEKAMQDFNHVLASDKDNVETYIRRAKVYKKQNNFDAALADLDQAVNLEPGNERALLDRGVIWMAKGQANQALKDLQQVLKIDPHHYGALVNCAGVYLFMGRYDLAIEQLNQAQAINSSDARVYKNRALCFLAQGKEKEALKDMEIALDLNPNDEQMRVKYHTITSLK